MERERLEFVQMTKEEQQILRMVMNSLRNNPDDWEIGQHTAKNRRLNVEVWHANRYYGVGIRGDGFVISDMVTAFTCAFGWLTWRRPLALAVTAVAARRFLAQSAKGGAA